MRLSRWALGGRCRMHATVTDRTPPLAVVPAVRAHSPSHPITPPARRRHVLRPSDPVYILDCRSHQLQSHPIPEHEAPLRLHCCKQLSLRSMHPKLARSQASPIPRWPVSQPLPLPSPDGVPRMLSVVPRVLVCALATTQPARWRNAGAKGARSHAALWWCDFHRAMSNDEFPLVFILASRAVCGRRLH